MTYLSVLVSIGAVYATCSWLVMRAWQDDFRLAVVERSEPTDSENLGVRCARPCHPNSKADNALEPSGGKSSLARLIANAFFADGFSK